MKELAANIKVEKDFIGDGGGPLSLSHIPNNEKGSDCLMVDECGAECNNQKHQDFHFLIFSLPALEAKEV